MITPKQIQFKYPYKSCICCGNAGHQVNDGWIMTLCDKHEKLKKGNHQNGLAGLIWFSEEDQAT